MMAKKQKTLIGWQEWCAFPDLNLPAVKAKVDSGAKSSALHAFNIKEFDKDGVQHVRFNINPVQGNNDLVMTCKAPLIDKRIITSSNGEREKRYVIQTKISFENKTITSEVTLTSRHKMRFRFLLGRECMRKARFTIDPAASFLLGKRTHTLSLYQ